MDKAGGIKVSVIVPVYNGEKYLARAVDSILAQTMKDIEIILIDDGSEDGTADVIRLYKEKYPNIIVDIYNEQNRSLGTTRNIGVTHARGEYIGFVDADDWIDSDFYEKMYRRAKEKDADIVRCGIMRVNDEGKMWIHSLPPESWDTELDDESKRRIVVDHFWGMWPCIFRRETWVESGFRVIEQATYDEDTTSVLFVLCARRMTIIREPIYKYWVNPVGTGSFNESVYEKAIYAAEKIVYEAKRLDLLDTYKEELSFFIITSILLNPLFFMENKSNYQTFPCKWLCFVLEGLGKIVPEYMNNKYLQKRIDMRTKTILRVGQMGVTQADYFFQHEDELIERNTYALISKYENYHIAIWGAAQRGNSFLKKYDAEAKRICKVIDKNEALHGERMPTGHFITSYEGCADKIDVIFVMNHKYYDEIVMGIKNIYGIEFVDYEKEIYQIEEALSMLSAVE